MEIGDEKRNSYVIGRYLRLHPNFYMTYLPQHYKKDPGLLTLQQLCDGISSALSHSAGIYEMQLQIAVDV
jgi:hypothetical protein